MADIAKLREIARAATPGPWAVDEPHQVASVMAMDYVCITRWEDEPLPEYEKNAAYIAAIPPELLLALLDCVEAADEITKFVAITTYDEARSRLERL